MSAQRARAQQPVAAAVSEDVVRAVAELVLNAISDELGRTLTGIRAEVQSVKERQDRLAEEVQAVKESVSKVALTVATEFVKQAVEAAIGAAGKGFQGQISLATEPVVSRLDAMEERLGKVEALLTSGAEGLRQAVEAALESVRRAADEGVKRVESASSQVSQISDALSKLSRDVSVLRAGVESIGKQLASLPRRDEVQVAGLAEKLDSLLAGVEALRRKLDVLEKRVESLELSPPQPQRRRGEREGEVEV